MDPIINVTGDHLKEILEMMDAVNRNEGLVYSLRFAFDEGGIKIKINNLGWSRAYGQIDPTSGIMRH